MTKTERNLKTQRDLGVCVKENWTFTWIGQDESRVENKGVVVVKDFNHTASGQLLSRPQTARGTFVNSDTPKNVTGCLNNRVQI